MAVGTVKWFNAEKGYGFIAPDGGGNDLFVHISAIVDAGPRGLAEGQKVEFEEGPGRKGPQATNVRRLVVALLRPPAPRRRWQREADGSTLLDGRG